MCYQGHTSSEVSRGGSSLAFLSLWGPRVFLAHPSPGWPHINYICKEPISKQGHILRFRVDMRLAEGGWYSIRDCIQLQTLNTEIAVAAIGLLLSLLLENRERTKSEFASNHVVNFWLKIKMRLIIINVFWGLTVQEGIGLFREVNQACPGVPSGGLY